MVRNKSLQISSLAVLLILASCSTAYFGVTTTATEGNTKHSKVKRLDWSGQQLKALPTGFTKYHDLQWLNLSNNPDLNLEQVFSQLSRLPKLEVVKLDSNRITELPKSINRVKNLKHLSLVSNPNLDLVSLVENLQHSNTLTSLNLSQNDIEELPKSLGKLTSLTNLKLSGNTIHSAENFVVLGEMPNLTMLWLDGNNIKILPATIGQLKVVKLYMDNNDISQLPTEITDCSKLCVMHLGNNKFETLPLEVIDMPMLYFLSLNRNRISAIPTAFEGSDYTLSAIILDDNRLSEEQIELAKKYFSGFFLLSL